MRAGLHSNMERNDNRNRAVIPFDFNGAEIRVIQDEQGEPWFIARDVARTLGYVNTNKAILDHCKKARDFNPHDSVGSGIAQPKIIPESDVYRLVMRSNLSAAERFQDWVVEEVLPAIRRSGGYVHATPEMSNEEIMALCRTTARQILVEKLHISFDLESTERRNGTDMGRVGHPG